MPPRVSATIAGLSAEAALPLSFQDPSLLRIALCAVASWGPMGEFRMNVDNITFALPSTR